MIDAKEKTALATSVGADERQSFQTSSANIIPTSDTEINHPDENSSENLEEIYRQMQRMNDPAYLHTVSMNGLYETVFQSRPPVIDGLLYSGTYLFAGAPKVGKSFFMAQLAYHISTGHKIEDLNGIKSVSICEYFTGWGEFARDGVADFLEKAVAKDVDVDDVDAVRENFEGKLDEDAIESIVDQIENDSICQFSADITTTVLMADGKVEKKYSFEAEG